MNNPNGSNSIAQIATFQVDHLLLGVNIDIVQEINRHMEITTVPHSPRSVRGVINLRGEVVTVVDIGTLLGLDRNEPTENCRCVVIHWQDERIGMIVDRIADILPIPESKIESPPANVDGVEGRFFQGVHAMEDRVVVLLDIEQLLDTISTNDQPHLASA